MTDHPQRLCWCENSRFTRFSDDYLCCDNCGTLVSQVGLSTEELTVRDDNQDFYGREYWFTHQEEDLGFKNITLRARLDLPERALHWLRTVLKYKLPAGKALELGSAHGGFVALLDQTGFDATGLELSAWVVDFARKTFDVPMLLGPIEDQQIELGTLDVIAFMDVLEHLPDPVGTMRRCLELLKPDGILVIQTPCYPLGTAYDTMLAANSPFLDQLKSNEHLYLYSQASIRKLFQDVEAEHLVFEPAIFGHYDMFVVVSRQPLAINTSQAIEEALSQSVGGRMIQALIDKETEAEQLRIKVVKTGRLEADVKYLKGQISTIEASQRAQLEQFNAQMAASEADRAARLQIIEQQAVEVEQVMAEIGVRLAASEADRSARLAVIERQGAELGRIPTLEADIEYLKNQIMAQEVERREYLKIIERQNAQLATIRPLLEHFYAAKRLTFALPSKSKHVYTLIEQALKALEPPMNLRADMANTRALDSVVTEEPVTSPHTLTEPEMKLEHAPIEPTMVADQDDAEIAAHALETNPTEAEMPDYVANIRDPKTTQGLAYTPESIDTIIQGLRTHGFRVEDLTLDPAEYRAYFEEAGYTTYYPTYYTFNLPEKSLEHFVATKLLDLNQDDVFIDIASEHSPVPNIYARKFGCVSYRQDLAYAPGMNVDRIGGDAANMPIPDGFASKMSLHCSFEHFEGDADVRFAREIGRVLRSGGRVSFTPIYLFHEYAILTDPTVAVKEHVVFEDDAVIYCKPGWQNRHGRFYDPAHLASRIKSNLGDLQMTIYRVTNATEVDPSCYIQFAAVISKP